MSIIYTAQAFEVLQAFLWGAGKPVLFFVSRVEIGHCEYRPINPRFRGE